jgi:hypothetical protein
MPTASRARCMMATELLDESAAVDSKRHAGAATDCVAHHTLRQRYTQRRPPIASSILWATTRRSWGRRGSRGHRTGAAPVINSGPSRWRKLAGRLAAGQDRPRDADERRYEAKQEPNCRPWAKAERCSREHPSRSRAQPFRDLVPWSEGRGSEVALIFSPALTALSPRRQPAGIVWLSTGAFGPRQQWRSIAW